MNIKITKTYLLLIFILFFKIGNATHIVGGELNYKELNDYAQVSMHAHRNNWVFRDKNLGGPVLKYIINVYDRKSIYRHLPLDVRKEDVAIAIWGKKDNPRLSHDKVKKAIDLYEYLQYDPLIDQYNAMINKSKEKVRIYTEMKIDEGNMDRVNKYEASMQKSTEGLKKLQERIQGNEDDLEIMGGGSNSLSFVEERLIKYRSQTGN